MHTAVRTLCLALLASAALFGACARGDLIPQGTGAPPHVRGEGITPATCPLDDATRADTAPVLVETLSPEEELRHGRARLARLLAQPDIDWARGAATQQATAAVSVLEDMAASPDPRTRANAFEGLAQTGDESYLEIGFAGLADPDPGVRDAARRYLARITIDTLLDRTLEMVLGGDPIHAAALDEALPRLRDRLENPLLFVLDSPEEPAVQRAAAAYCLGRMGSAAATEYLAAYALAPEPPVAIACAEALATIGDPQSLPALAALAGSPEPRIRLAAVVGLGKIGGPQALAMLESMAGNDYEPVAAVRREAVALLGYIGGESSIPVLIKVMNRYHDTRDLTFYALERITGLGIGPSPTEWTRWYNEWLKAREAQQAPALGVLGVMPGPERRGVE